MAKIGRNDPCPCGSGKKYKKCCLEKDLTERRELSPPAANGPEWEEVEDPEAQEFIDLAAVLNAVRVAIPPRTKTDF